MFALKRHMSLLSVGALLLAGCFGSDSDEDDDKDAVVFVSVGNSLTAGFQSNGLRKDWQENSYPALIAKAMGIADYQLPLIDTPGIGRLKIDGKTASPLVMEGATIAPKPLTRPTSDMLLNRSLPRPYNNLGVPGATTLDFMNAYDSNTSQSKGNGYFNIVLRGGLFQNSTMLRQAIQLKPTVMTLWLGNNDILGGITAGTVVEGVTVTPTAVYTALMDKALDTLLRETTAHIFMANIPSIVTIPFVTTVPKVVISATFQPVIDTATKSPIPVLTKEADVEYILLPALAEYAKGTGVPKGVLNGTGDSLAVTMTLTKAEVATANKLTDEYNAYLKKKAEDNASRITLVDVNKLLADLKDGKIAGLSAKFPLLDASGSAFSLDGVHPNTKGYRHVTNLFIDAINDKLGKNYEKVSTTP